MYEDRYVYIVEGKNDFNKLYNLGLRYILITHGRNVNQDFLDFLLNFKERKFALLFDPDRVGKMLCDIVSKFLTDKKFNFEIINLDKKECTNIKIGVENATNKYLKQSLSKFILHEENQNKKVMYLTKDDFFEIVNNSNNKQNLLNYLHLQKASNKKLLDYLNMKKLDCDKLKMLLNEI